MTSAIIHSTQLQKKRVLLVLAKLSSVAKPICDLDNVKNFAQNANKHFSFKFYDLLFVTLIFTRTSPAENIPMVLPSGSSYEVIRG